MIRSHTNTVLTDVTNSPLLSIMGQHQYRVSFPADEVGVDIPAEPYADSVKTQHAKWGELLVGGMLTREFYPEV